MTDLLEAIENGQVQVVKDLITRSQSDERRLDEAFNHASLHGQKDIVNILLKQKRNYNIEEGLFNAAMNEHYELMEYLETKGFIHWEFVIMTVAFKEKWKSANWLVERAELKGHKLAWNEMLYNAAFSCQEPAVHYFIQKGASPRYGMSGTWNAIKYTKERKKYQSILFIMKGYCQRELYNN